VNDTYNDIAMRWPASTVAIRNSTSFCSFNDWVADTYRDITSGPCAVGYIGPFINTPAPIVNDVLSMYGHDMALQTR